MTHEALIFCHSIPPRLQYVADFLSEYYGLLFKIVCDEEKYTNAQDHCKINYSYRRLVPGEIFIHPHVLLYESYIRQVKIECFQKNANKTFFKAEGDFGFDLFAAIFYLLSRYEEYLPHQKDNYGRYAHENSIAFKEGFLHLPLINLWLEDFRKLLAEKNTRFSILHVLPAGKDLKKPSQFSFLPTYDIDMAWSFKNKGFKINAGVILLLLLKFQFRKMIHRINILRGKIQDPFDSFNWMDSLHRKYKLKPIYFFLVPKEKGKYDKNIDVKNPEFLQLIKYLASNYKAALHPSWASEDTPSLVIKEKQTLEEISGQTIDTSRQHFIRFQLPATYQRLLSSGITHDHSMGYGSTNGFRASIANSFYWYDLKKEEKTNLLIHPFCFMDANSFYEQKFSVDEAWEELIQYYSVIKSVNGTMITIWHNNFLGTAKEFSGWREMYERFVTMIFEDVNRQS